MLRRLYDECWTHTQLSGMLCSMAGDRFQSELSGRTRLCGLACWAMWVTCRKSDSRRLTR